MKKIFLLIAVSLSFIRCNDDISNEYTYLFVRSYICEYIDNDLTVSPRGAIYPIYEPIGISGWFPHYDVSETGRTVRYLAPEFGSTGSEAERFLEIAERNGDLSYNQKILCIEGTCQSPAICCADNFKAMHVRCLNAAWDDAHPAGTPLDDITVVEYYSYAEFVRNGYRTGASSVQKLLKDLTSTDLAMPHTIFNYSFVRTPPAGTYEMEVTFVTTEGEEKSATCTLAIE